MPTVITIPQAQCWAKFLTGLETATAMHSGSVYQPGTNAKYNIYAFFNLYA